MWIPTCGTPPRRSSVERGAVPPAYFRIGAVENGFTRVPLRVPIGVTTANATAFIVGEGLPVPLSRITLESRLSSP